MTKQTFYELRSDGVHLWQGDDHWVVSYSDMRNLARQLIDRFLAPEERQDKCEQQ